MKNKKYFYCSFSNLNFFDAENREPNDFHQFIERDKKCIYIPDRGQSNFSWVYCQNTTGCYSYSYSQSSDVVIISKEIDVIPSFKELILGANNKNFKDSLSILEEMFTNNISCCMDCYTAKYIYNELLPYQSLSADNFKYKYLFQDLLSILEIGSAPNGIVIKTDNENIKI